jgi:hypothetical protein
MLLRLIRNKYSRSGLMAKMRFVYAAKNLKGYIIFPLPLNGVGDTEKSVYF